MRWLADECVVASLVAWLRAEGHDVTYIGEMAQGLRDSEVAALAAAGNRLLLTEDKDFGELIFRFGHPVPGLVLLRIDPSKPSLKAARLSEAIRRYGESLFGRYVVIEEARLRSRPLRKDR